MTKLSEQDKTWIVILLARFEPPAAVVVRMREDCGVDTDRFQVRTYDPTSARYEAGEKWRELFWSERERHLKEVADIPIAHKAYRLNMLQRVLDGAMAKKEYGTVQSALRQAAEEIGGALTNERRMIQTQDNVDELTAEERRAMFEELIRRVLEAKAPLQPQLSTSESHRRA